jgi:hypothetical protein
MSPNERDDETQRIPDDDETQAWSSVDEPTRMMPVDGESLEDEATRRMDQPLAEPSDPPPTRRMDPPPAIDPPPTRRIGQEEMPYQPSVAAPRTEVLHVPVKRPVGTWVVATIVALALIAGGVIGYAQRRPSDANVVARALVSPDGGVMTFDGTGKLTVPKGALPAPTAITIRKDTIDQTVRLGAEGDPSSVTYDPGEIVVYAFEPADLRFQQPVTIELPRTGTASAVFVDARGSPRVMGANTDGDTVKVETTSFSFEPTSSAVGGGT